MRKPEADEFVFFWGGIFSNFHPIGSPEFTSEKVYMALKAAAFRDANSIQFIKFSMTPRDAKKAGREIKGFDEKIWDEIKIQCMMMALDVKFHSCPEFREALKATDTKILVEASPVDKIWGIGFAEKDAIANVDKWGQNLLGECLMDLRFQRFGF